jgi:hypothetical protein
VRTKAALLSLALRRLHQRLQQQPRHFANPGTRHAIAARQRADGHATGVAEAPWS